MNSDPASLENLRDIVTPAPVSWWPFAAGWWVLVVVACLALAFGSWRIWQRWRKNAYRREALAMLERAASVTELASLLKRTALGAYPRCEVASLTGAAWCRFLIQSGGVPMPQDVSDELTRGLFMEEHSDATESVRSYAMTWVRRHRQESASMPMNEPKNRAATEGSPC